MARVIEVQRIGYVHVWYSKLDGHQFQIELVGIEDESVNPH